MSYQRSGPPPKDGSSGAGGYNSASSKSQGYPYAPGFYTTGPQGYPGAPRPGFPIAGAQSPNVQPQSVPPPPPPFWSVDAVPIPTGKDKDEDISYADNVGDRAAVVHWGLPAISRLEDPAKSRDAHTSFPDSHSHDGDGKKSLRQTNDGDRKAGKLSSLNLDVLLQNEQLTNLFAGMSKATDDSTIRHKAQQAVQTSSADVPQKPKSILKRKTVEERVDVESQVSTESQVSSDSFSKLSAIEKTLHLLSGKTNVEDAVKGSEKGSRGSEKPSFNPAGALSQLESYNDSGDDNDHAEKDTNKQTKAKKSTPSTRPFWSADAALTGREKDKDSKLPDIQEQLYEKWGKSMNRSSNVHQATSKEQDVSKINQLSQQTGQTHSLASSSQTKQAGDNNEELDSTVQNILQSIGFNIGLSKRTQARPMEQQDVLHTGMINKSASFLGQSGGLVQGVRAALFSDKQEKVQLDSLIQGARASMQQRSSRERSASPDAFSAETQSGKNSYSRKGKNPDPDNGRSSMGVGSREIGSDRHLENLQNKDWEQVSPDEDEMGGIESRKITETQSRKKSYSRIGKNPDSGNGRSRMGLGSREIGSDRHLENLQNKDWEQISPDEDEMDGIESRKIHKMKGLPHERHAEVGQRPFSKERDAALPRHDTVLLDEARKSKHLPHGSHEKSLRPSERFTDEPKDEHIYQDVSKPLKAAALLAALCSKQKEISSSGSKSLKLPLQSGSARVENLHVTSRTVHSDDDDDDEPYIESMKVILPSKSDVRIVSQSPVIRKSQSPETKVPRKRPTSPLPSPVSKEQRVLNEKRSFTVLQAFLKKSLEQNVDSCDESPLLQTLLAGLKVGGLPAAERAESHRDNVRKSPDRTALISPDVRTSRSPGMSRSPEGHKARLPEVPMSRASGRQKSRSPGKRKSTSLDKGLSRSPDRRNSRLPDKMKSKSPDRQTSRSPVRRKSSLPGIRVSRSPDRRKSVSPRRHRSRSTDRSRSRSSDRHRSRSADRRRSRSPHRHRSRSSDRSRSRSPHRRRSRSPDKSTSRSPHRLKARSPVWARPRSPARYKSKSPSRHRSRSTSQRRSSSPGQRKIRSPSVLPSQATPPVKQMLPAGQQNLAPQIQTSHPPPPVNQQMWPAGQQNLAPQIQTSHPPPPVNQHMWPAGQQNLAPQVQTSHPPPLVNQQMWPAGQQNLAPQVQTSQPPPPVNQQMWPAGQQNLAPQVQTSHPPPPVNQQMWPAGQQNLAPQVQTPHAPPLVNQQMWPAGQQNLAPQVHTPHAPPPVNQQMWPAGQQNLVPKVQTSHPPPPVNQQIWPAGQQNLVPKVQTFPTHRTAAPNWPAGPNWQATPNWQAAQNCQLPEYQRQNVYGDTNTTIINTYNMSILPPQDSVPTMYDEDLKALPAAQSKELSEEQQKEPPKEQPKEQVQELPYVQEKEPEKDQEQQQNQDPSKSVLKNDTKSEVDIFGEFPVYERKIIFTKMAQMNTAERQKLAQDLSQTQTKLAELKAEMAKLVKEQNEIMQQTGVVDANMPQLTQNKKAQANLTEEVRRLLKASNYVSEKTDESGERQFKIPKLQKQKPAPTVGSGAKMSSGHPEMTSGQYEADSARAAWEQADVSSLTEAGIKAEQSTHLGRGTQVSGTPGPQAHQEQDYDYYDCGNHWCAHCSLGFYSAPQMLYHIGTNAHRKGFVGHKQPWKKAEPKQTKHRVGWTKRKLGRRQIKGADMMCSVLGLYCKVCREFCGPIPDAVRHMKTDSHYDKYMKFVKCGEAILQRQEVKHDSDDKTPSDPQRSSRNNKVVHGAGVGSDSQNSIRDNYNQLAIGLKREVDAEEEDVEQDSAHIDQEPFPDLVETECDFLDIPMPELFPQQDIAMSEEGDLDTKPILTYTVKPPLQVREEKKKKSIDDEKRAKIPDYSRKVISTGQADDRKKIKSSSSWASDSRKDKSVTDSEAERKKKRKKNATFMIEDSSEDEEDASPGDKPTPAKQAKLSTPAAAAAGQDKAKITPKASKSSTSKSANVSSSSATKSSTSAATKSSTSASVKSSTSAAKKVFTSATTNSSTPVSTKVSTLTADTQMKMKKVSTTPASTHAKEKVNTPTTTKVTSLTTPATDKVSTSSASKVSSSSASKISTSSTTSYKKSKVSTPTAANVSTSASSSKKKTEASTATSSSKTKADAPTVIKKHKVADVRVVDSKEGRTAIEEIRIGNRDSEQGSIASSSEDSCNARTTDDVNQKGIGPVKSRRDSKEEESSSDNEHSHADVKQNKEDTPNENVQTKTSVKSTFSKSTKKQKHTKGKDDLARAFIEEDSLSDLTLTEDSSSDSQDEPEITPFASRGHGQGKKSKSSQGRKPGALSDVKVVIELLKISQPTVKCGEMTNSKKLSSSSSSVGLSGANPLARKPQKASSKKDKIQSHATIDLTRQPVVKLRRLTDREIASYIRKAAKKSSLYHPRPLVRGESVDSNTTVADETEDCPATLRPAARGGEECEAKGSAPNNVLQSSDIPLSGEVGDGEDADSCEAKGFVPNNVLQSLEGKDIPLSGEVGDREDADSCEAKGSVPNKEDADSCEAKGSVPDNVLQSSEGKDIPLSGVVGDIEDTDSCEVKGSVPNKDADSCEVKGSVPNNVLQSSEGKDIPLSGVVGDGEDADSCEVKGSIPNNVLQSSEGKDIPLSGVVGDGEDADSKFAAVSEQEHP